MKVYKGTDKDIKCRGYQFTPGVEAVEDRAELCEAGFHACEAPLDVLGYYPPGTGARYFEAELEDVSDERHIDDSKVCGKRITLGAEIGIPGLVKAHVEYVKEHTTKQATAGFRGAATAGSYGAATSRGKSATGKNGLSVVRGNGVMAKGGIGTVIVIAIENDGDYDLKEWKAGVIDGEALKPDTWYTLKNGEFMEVSEDE